MQVKYTFRPFNPLVAELTAVELETFTRIIAKSREIVDGRYDSAPEPFVISHIPPPADIEVIAHARKIVVKDAGAGDE